MMHVDTDPDTQVRQFNRFSLQFILAIAIPILAYFKSLPPQFQPPIYKINSTYN